MSSKSSKVIDLESAEIITPAEWQTKPKTAEERLAEEIGEENAEWTSQVITLLATRAHGLERICGEVLREPEESWPAAAERFRYWRVRSKTLTWMYAQAREARADLLTDEIFAIADAPLEGKDPASLRAAVEQRKLQVDARKWAAGKFNRGMFGDDPVVSGSVTVDHTHNAGALVDELQRRLAKKAKRMLTGPGGGGMDGSGQ